MIGMMQRRIYSGGFSLITTLFVLVVLSVLGSYMVRLSTVQGQTTLLSLQATRAAYAARSGLEWARYQISTTSSCPSVPTSFSSEGFTIQLTTCDSSVVAEGGGPGGNYVLYHIEMSASRGAIGEADYVVHRVDAIFKNP